MSTKKDIPVTKPATETTEELPVFPAVEKVEADKTRKFDNEAKALFSEHLTTDSFYFTSDALAFFRKNDAHNHASTLEDKTVISKKRK